jgi:predicted PurR-regulated permease PerM
VLWGIFALVMRFVPYIGAFLSAVLPIALAAAVDPGWSMVLSTFLLFAMIQSPTPMTTPKAELRASWPRK